MGVWPRALAEVFQSVWTFEANPRYWEAFCANTEGYDNIIHHRIGLWHTTSKANIVGEKTHNMGGWHLEFPGNEVDLYPGDAFQLYPDLIMLDIEGAELYALMGLLKTIRRTRPVIVVETKEACLNRFGHSVKMLEEWLIGEGYRKRETFHEGRDQLWTTN